MVDLPRPGAGQVRPADARLGAAPILRCGRNKLADASPARVSGKREEPANMQSFAYMWRKGTWKGQVFTL
jgi:hypothetical protein